MKYLPLNPEIFIQNRKRFVERIAIRAYDVSRDGRFLLNLPAESHASNAFTLVTHWSAVADTLRRDKK